MTLKWTEMQTWFQILWVTLPSQKESIKTSDSSSAVGLGFFSDVKGRRAVGGFHTPAHSAPRNLLKPRTPTPPGPPWGRFPVTWKPCFTPRHYRFCLLGLGSPGSVWGGNQTDWPAWPPRSPARFEIQLQGFLCGSAGFRSSNLGAHYCLAGMGLTGSLSSPPPCRGAAASLLSRTVRHWRFY